MSEPSKAPCRQGLTWARGAADDQINNLNWRLRNGQDAHCVKPSGAPQSLGSNEARLARQTTRSTT